MSMLAESVSSGVTAYPWKTDAITTEVVRHALETIADEMGTQLRRTALSVVIKDMRDYACAVMDSQAHLLATNLTLPTLLASMQPALAVCIEKWGADIHPGDVFITNHPYKGCAHSNDVQIFVPGFDAEGELLGFTGTIAHHADWGGTVPGTVQSAALSVFEEGVLFPALKLEFAGVVNTTIYDIIGANTRYPSQNFGDLRGQVAAARAGARRLEELFAKYGTERANLACDDLLGYTEMRTRRAIERLPDGVYTADGYLDDDGVNRGTPVRIAISVTVSGDEMVFDFEGTDPQMRSGMNVPWATTLSGIQYAAHCILPADIPFNGGCNAPLTVKAPLGSLLNPTMPAAVGARHITSQRMASVITKALVPIAPERTSAEWSVGWPCLFAESWSPKTGEGVAVLLNQGGGAGAKSTGDGADGLDPHMSNCVLVSAEAVESGYMLRVERMELVADSGGAGAYRGGLGIRGDYRNISDKTMYARTEVEQNTEAFLPQGLDGGAVGSKTSSTMFDAEGVETVVPPKETTYLKPGEILSLRAGGGAGYGDPKARPRELTLRDLELKKITAEAAAAIYGVVA
ncbi:hydantoinase B/oxoprolinase family protein [Subtercola endophyticus]|uniref:hydantoinase B/oxoprolinase family protein n=1 Tax=Subtercola endophyticus TaxID=2895559 RepID=UPI001E502C52|nr:hydantoinase B/oxoprolinase family protein [Subtercola endophyticus]UFS58608.1 hydantoinase B/oxoprolinase family protein [Subtercola endophyticus]